MTAAGAPRLAALAVIGWCGGAPAQEAVVPVEQAAYHVPVMSNEYVTVLNVRIPPGRSSGFHRHSLDTFGVQITDTPRTGQLPGAAATQTPLREPGTVQWAPYAAQPNVHAVRVTGDGVFHNVVVELRQAAPLGASPGSRESGGYSMVLDNPRVRAWRLVLAPGERAAPITQVAPGLRIVVRGSEIVEHIDGRPARGMALGAGEFYWQDAGVTRAIENAGATPLEVVELELK
jgi:hypothetical protein